MVISLIIAVVILIAYILLTKWFCGEIPTSLSFGYYLWKDFFQKRKYPDEIKRLKEIGELLKGELGKIDRIKLIDEKEEIEHKLNKVKGWPFQVTLGLLAALIAPSWFEYGDLINPNTTWLGFLSCAFLIGVAIKADYLFGDRTYHYTFAILAAVLSLIWVSACKLTYVDIILFMIAAIVSYLNSNGKAGNIIERLKKGGLILWFETAAILSIIISLLIISAEY